MDFPKLNPIVLVCDLRLRSKELENMGVRMSILTKKLMMRNGNEVQEESEDEEASYEVLQEKLKLLQSTLENAENERTHLEQKYEEVHKNCLNLRDQLENREKQISELQKESNRLDSLNKEIEDLKSKLENEKKINKDFSSQIVRLHSLVKIGQDALKAEQEMVKKLKGQLEGMQDSDSEDPDYEDSDSEDPDYEKEIVKENKRSIEKEPVTATVTRKVKRNLSAYEQMIQKNREEKMAFLQSLQIEEAKLDLVKSVEEKKKKTIPVKRKYKEQTSPPDLRKSKRLANIPTQDLSEDKFFVYIVNAAGEKIYRKRVIPPMMTFKEALKDDDLYKSYVTDLSIKESKCDSKFITYEKSHLKNLTLAKSNIIKVTPVKITTLTWHPSPEQLIVAAGDRYGNLGVLNVSNKSSPYLMSIHDGIVTNMQFSPFNHAQLISSGYDGILRCGDMVQHKFNEIYNVSGQTLCTYFDILTETTFIVAQSDGNVAVVDSRINGKSFEEKRACHDYPIETVNIHPVNRNVFVSADNIGSIRIWDLRKLQKNPVAEMNNPQKNAVYAAYFSPVTGNSILATSAHGAISIFDCSDLTKIKLKHCMQHNNQTGRWLTVFRAMWLPYSEEAFVIGSMDYPRRVKVYDNNMFVYNIMHENFKTVTSVNVFHPRRHVLASGNSSGTLCVFT